MLISLRAIQNIVGLVEILQENGVVVGYVNAEVTGSIPIKCL